MAVPSRGVGRSVHLVISYTVFGALMAVSVAFCVAVFSSIDFSTGGSPMGNGELIELLRARAVSGALVGLTVGVVRALLPGERGTGLHLVSAVLIPVASMIASVAWAAAVSVVLVIVRGFVPDVLDHQRTIIMGGVWAIPALVLLTVLFGRPTPPGRTSGGYVGSGYTGGSSLYGSGASAGPVGAGFGYGGATTYRTSRDLFGGGTTSYGSDGSTYRTTSDLFGGGTTTHGSDGTTYHTTSDLFGGGTTTHGSDGATYHTTKDFFGDGYTTRGDDGSVMRTSKDLFGDGTTTRRD